MMKTRSLLAVLACAAMACASAFASPAPTAPPGFDRADIQAVRQDVSPAPLTVAESGAGAASAFKAFEAQRKAQPATVPRLSTEPGLGSSERVAMIGGGSGDAPQEHPSRPPHPQRPLARG